MLTNWQWLREYIPESVKGILILVGLSDPSSFSPYDRSQALEPAERFTNAAQSLGDPTPDRVIG